MSIRTIGFATCTFLCISLMLRFRGQVMQGIRRRLLLLSAVPMGSRERVLVVGSGVSGQFAAWQLTHSDVGLNAFQLVGFVDDDLTRRGMRISGVKVLGKVANIRKLVDDLEIGIIVFAVHNISTEARRELLELCEQTTAEVLVMPDYVGKLQQMTNELAANRLESRNECRSAFLHPEPYEQRSDDASQPDRTTKTQL